jgi:hypothetical protein
MKHKLGTYFVIVTLAMSGAHAKDCDKQKDKDCHDSGYVSTRPAARSFFSGHATVSSGG